MVDAGVLEPLEHVALPEIKHRETDGSDGTRPRRIEPRDQRGHRRSPSPGPIFDQACGAIVRTFDYMSNWSLVRRVAGTSSRTRPHSTPASPRAALRLVTCHSFPQTSATGDQFAQLGLLRLLWLQRETRRSVRAGHVEASAMLARACVDTCLLGLFCLHVPDAPSRLEGQSSWSLNELFALVRRPVDLPRHRAQGRDRPNGLATASAERPGGTCT